MLNKYAEINFKIVVYPVGYVYLAIIYILSFALPFLKRILMDFEKRGSNKSLLTISIISGSILWIPIYLSRIDNDLRSFTLIIWFIGNIVLGYFVLMLLFDLKRNFKK